MAVLKVNGRFHCKIGRGEMLQCQTIIFTAFEKYKTWIILQWKCQSAILWDAIMRRLVQATINRHSEF